MDVSVFCDIRVRAGQETEPGCDQILYKVGRILNEPNDLLDESKKSLRDVLCTRQIEIENAFLM